MSREKKKLGQTKQAILPGYIIVAENQPNGQKRKKKAKTNSSVCPQRRRNLLKVCTLYICLECAPAPVARYAADIASDFGAKSALNSAVTTDGLDSDNRATRVIVIAKSRAATCTGT